MTAAFGNCIRMFRNSRAVLVSDTILIGEVSFGIVSRSSVIGGFRLWRFWHD